MLTFTRGIVHSKRVTKIVQKRQNCVFVDTIANLHIIQTSSMAINEVQGRLNFESSAA